MYHNMEEASTLWNYANKKKGIQLESQSLSNNLLYRAGIIKNSPDGPFLRHEFPCFSSSSPSSTFSSLKFSFVFSLPLCSHVVSLSLSLSLSISDRPQSPFCGFTSWPDFTNGHGVLFWGNVSHVVPPFSRESCFHDDCLLPRARTNEIIENG